MAGISVYDSVYNSYAGSSRPSYDAMLERRPSSYLTTYSSSYSRSYPSSSSTTSHFGYGSSGNASSSAYDRYHSYLDETLSSASASSSSRRPVVVPVVPAYRSRYLLISDLIPDSDESDSARKELTVRGTTLISSAPVYDKFGKELSNYERWKLKQGEPLSTASAALSSTDGPTAAAPERPTRKKYSVRFKEEEDAAVTASKSVSSASSSSSGSGSDSSRSSNNSSSLSGARRKSSGREVSLVPIAVASASSPRETSPLTALSTPKSYSSYRSSSSSSSNPSHSFPSGVREKLASYDVRDVRGDGGCYYRCLSLFFSGSEDNYMRYRREVMSYIRENIDNYSSMIRSEIGQRGSTNDYFSRKTRADRQDWAETTEIIATCCVYNINVHVLALVPGRLHSWEWLHFDPSIGTGRPSHASKDIFLYNAGSVHFMLCMPK